MIVEKQFKNSMNSNPDPDVVVSCVYYSFPSNCCMASILLFTSMLPLYILHVSLILRTYNFSPSLQVSVSFLLLLYIL